MSAEWVFDLWWERPEMEQALWDVEAQSEEWSHRCSICGAPCNHFRETVRQDCQCERECPER